jgi:hypothetical protein
MDSFRITAKLTQSMALAPAGPHWANRSQGKEAARLKQGHCFVDD